MAKALMIQGTMSNAGKSLVTAGLCRVFHQDGFKVAPFKSQNMALNSFITTEGKEMGRAQVVQAEAAGIQPSALMNPILLKPTSECGCQVILHGKPLGTMSAQDYFQFRTSLLAEIKSDFLQLAAANEFLVIEGAGSPAEINLKEHDIVNMGIAKMAQAPVLLVADIDRGGVFAAVYGTLMLLEAEERRLVKGIIINKFRGDVDILKPGLQLLEAKTGVPVLGVLPMLSVDLEDEDSLSERLTVTKEASLIDIVVLKLPHMSNYTDFNIFELMEGVSLRYVSTVQELHNPDMLIVPGSKNTMTDLRWLRQNGLEAALLKKAQAGVVIFGICGGYQLLGDILADLEGYEAGGLMAGMGLLAVDTYFTSTKQTEQVAGAFAKVEGVLAPLSGLKFHGYEIHCGQSKLKAKKTLTHCGLPGKQEAWEAEGCQNTTAPYNVYGTYVHGIFDDQQIVAAVVRALLQKKGLRPADVQAVDYQAYKESQYDQLAAALRANLDMERIYRIIREGVGCNKA